MRKIIRDWILMVLWVLIINFSFYFGYHLDHWSSLFFLMFAGGLVGFLIGEKFSQ